MVNLTKQQREQKTKSTANHLLYALRFLRERMQNASPTENMDGVTFRFTHFANYMLDNSPEFINHRESLRNAHGQPFPKSYYLNSKRTYLEHLINELIIKGYVSMAGRVQSERNPDTVTILYMIDKWEIPAAA